LPLSEAYPGQEIELTTISSFDCHGFLSDYAILFVEGCHVKRKVRNLGEKDDLVITYLIYIQTPAPPEEEEPEGES
jgi:hypothetical protein